MDIEIQHYKFTKLANTQLLKEENKKNMVSSNKKNNKITAIHTHFNLECKWPQVNINETHAD